MKRMHDVVKIIGQDFIILSVLGFLGVWFGLDRAAKKTLAFEFVVAGVIALALAKLGNAFYHDPRPFIANHTTPWFTSSTDNGFPSDHTLLASLIGFLAVRVNRRVGIALLALAVLIAVARVVAGVHHVTDVVGSFIFSGIAAWVTIWAFKRFMTTSEKQG